MQRRPWLAVFRCYSAVVDTERSLGATFCAEVCPTSFSSTRHKMRLVEQYIAQLGEVMDGRNVSLFPANLASLIGVVDELKEKRDPMFEGSAS